MIRKQTGVRTRITDLPEVAVELSENELRIVAGGAKAAAACNVNVASTSVGTARSQYVTGKGDWDND